MAGTATTCTAQDQCHTAGVRDPSTGACSNPTKQDGSSCNDGNACTANDTCQSGICTAGTLVLCPAASDPCHDDGVCNPATGTCSNPAKANGTSCSNGDLCLTGQTCQSGVCSGGTPRI